MGMAEVGDVFGDWILLRLLEKGTFSSVFLARHQTSRHYAAVKVVDRRLDEKQARIYVDQKLRLMRLEHSHLVHILDVGEQEGHPFLAMEYAAHGTLRARHPPGEQVPLELILAYLQQIASALQYLHESGVIHGDIKPEKFLIESDGRVVVGDVGPPQEAVGSGYGVPRRLIETLYYMAPERKQANQKLPRRPLDQAADQYALGAVLYTWISGSLPFPMPAESSTDAPSLTPPSLQQYVPSLPQKVEDVVFRALGPNPEDRFESVAAFAQAFERACLPRRAIPLPRPESIEIVIGGSTGSLGLLTYTGHTGTITSLAWSPDGKRIASASGDRTVQVWDAETGTLVVPPYMGHQAPVLTVDWAVSAPQNLLASGGVDGTVQVWTVTPHRVVGVCKLGILPMSAVAWSPDGKFLAVGVEKQVQIWRADAPGVVVERYDQQAVVKSVAWSPVWPSVGNLHRAMLASGDEEAKVHIWSPGRAEPHQVYERHRTSVGVVAWSPDGKYVASGGGQTVQVWRVEDKEPIFTTLPSRAKGLPAVSWQPQPYRTGKGMPLRLAVTGFEATVEVWDVLEQKSLWVHRGHAGLGLAVAWSPDGSRIASGGFDQQVQVWRLA